MDMCLTAIFNETRQSYLQQVSTPVLRDELIALCRGGVEDDEMQTRYFNRLGSEPANVKAAIRKLTRVDLLRLIDDCPEFNDAHVRSLYESNLYGVGTSIHIFLFDKIALADTQSLHTLQAKLRNSFAIGLSQQCELSPPAKELKLRQLEQVPNYSAIVEGRYSFLRRFEYIDENECAVTSYETVYGFFWLDSSSGYAILQALRTNELKAVRCAIESALDTELVHMRITKELRDRLLFLRKENMRAARLYDPFPKSGQFQTLVAEDPFLNEKIADLMKGYPQVRNARYIEYVSDTKSATLAVSERGSLGLRGRFRSSEFRAWAVSRLNSIVTAHRRMQSETHSYLETLDLTGFRELDIFENEKQRLYFMEIAKAALVMKGQSRSSLPLSISPLQLASAFGDLMHVQLPISCAHVGCDFRGQLHCRTCGDTRLMVLPRRPWRLTCSKHRTEREPWRIPVCWTCDNLHPIEMSLEEVESKIEIFMDTTLQELLAKVTKKCLPQCAFNAGSDQIYVSGRSSIYYSQPRSGEAQRGFTQNIQVAGNYNYQENVLGTENMYVGGKQPDHDDLTMSE